MNNKKYALITGATSGIGAAFAAHLAQSGYNLIITGRREKIIQKVAGEIKTNYKVDVRVILADFSMKNDLDRLTAYLNEIDNIEILVNNAGFGNRKLFFDDDFNNQEKMLKVHINAVVRLTRRIVPKMIKNGKGIIINVSSLAAFLPSSTTGIYCATKAFINTFSESMHIILKDKNIKVQALCPGFTRTDFHQKLDIGRSMLKNKGIIRWMAADDVVKISLAALKKRKVIVIPGFFNKLIKLLITLLPKNLYYKSASLILKKIP
ncbi:MAG: SDR family oxidoreductase [Candidatus Omnitrophota bacterium]|nr:SDR family oxidoreductase [Candidatus Omnitrophota bacterium]